MFKTITVFRIKDKKSMEALRELDFYVTRPTIRDPDKTAWFDYGFGETPYDGAVLNNERCTVFNVQFRERMLPGKVIKAKLAERATEIGNQQGYRPGKKQLMEIKEQLIAELLPASHIKSTDFPCMVTGSYLIVGTGNASKVDMILKLLVITLEDVDLGLVRITDNLDVPKFLIRMLMVGTTDSVDFTLGSSGVLVGPEKATVRLKGIDLLSEDVQTYLSQGFRPTQLVMTYKERLSFTLTDKLIIRSLAFLDVMLEEAAQEADDAIDLYHATAVLVAGELRELLDNLTNECKTEEEEL